MQAVVTAGGAGTRLRPLTTAVPKALLPVVGEPMLSRVVRHLAGHGATRCVVTLQHQASVVLKYFSAVAGLDVRFLTEPRPLGTAGSVRYALEWLDDDDVLVISGDCLTDIDVAALLSDHRRSGAELTMALARRPDPRDFGVVSVGPDGRVLRLVEKPSWGEVTDDTVNTGIYCVSRSLIAALTPGEEQDWAKDVIPRLLGEGRDVRGRVVDGYWEDVGTFRSYMQAQRDVLDGRVHCGVDAYEVSPGVWVATGAEVSPDAIVRAPSYIGPFAKIETGAIIGPYTVIGTNALVRGRAVVERTTLHPNAYIGPDVDCRGAVVGRGTELRQGARVLDGAVIADNCVILDGAMIGTSVLIYPGKTVEEGAVVDESIVWESTSQRQVFGAQGVRGIVNVDMTPERIVRLAAAYATTLPKGATVTVGRDHSRAARSLNRALVGSLTAAGMNLRDLRDVTTALVRNDTARYSDGGVILRTTQGRADSIDVLFLDEHGAEIGTGQREAIERTFTRREFRRPLPADIGDIRTPHRVLDDYVGDVEAAIPLQSIRQAPPRLVIDAGNGPAASVLSLVMGRLGIDALTVGTSLDEALASDGTLHSGEALERVSGLVRSSAARLGARLGPVGERLSIVDEAGDVIDDGRMLLIMLDLVAASRHSGMIAVPVTTSRLAEQVAAYHGVGILRIGSDASALAGAARDTRVVLAGDGRGRFVLPAVGPGPDAVVALVMLLSLMSQTELTLSALNARIPETSVLARSIPVPWAMRGAAMRLVRERARDAHVDALDGIRISSPAGEWCLVLPKDDEAVFMLYAEATDAADATALLDRWQSVVEESL